MHPQRSLGAVIPAAILAASLAWAPTTWAQPRVEAPDHMTTLHEEGLDAPAALQQPDDCAAAVRGVALQISRTPSGATLTFTSPTRAGVAALRLMLRETAATLEYHSKLAALHPELVAAGADVIPPVDVSIKDSPTGALMTLRAEDPHDAGRVQAHLVALEQMWDGDRCVRAREPAQLTTAGLVSRR